LAENYAGVSIYSEPITITIGERPNPPTQLQQVQLISLTQIQITWTKDLPIADNPVTTAFRVYLDDLEGNEPHLVYDTGAQALTNMITLNDLTTGNTYDVTVRAVNEIGESDASNVLEIYAGTVPSKIQYLDWHDSSVNSVTVRWQLPETNGGLTLTKFTLYIDIGQSGTYSPLELQDTF
jgi:hypothetical protein